MKKLLCPQCKIPSMYVKNNRNERLLVYVDEQKNVIPKNPEDCTDGFDFSIVYCLGCSWSGTPKKMVKY